MKHFHARINAKVGSFVTTLRLVIPSVGSQVRETMENDDRKEESRPLVSSPPTNRYDSVNEFKGLLEDSELPLQFIFFILSTAFAYGCILTTLFLITLPLECQRMHSHSSIALGMFVSLAGLTQLVSPVIGRISDTYRPVQGVGQRLPYHVVGTTLTVLGLIGQMLSAAAKLWIRYGIAFCFTMVGLNIMYAIMLAILADQIPSTQMGVGNGVLAFQIVSGSLFGFGLFHSVLAEDLQSMYGLYTCIVIVAGICTGLYGNDKDVELAVKRGMRRNIIDNFEKNEAFTDAAELGADNTRPTGAPRFKKAVRRAKEIVVVTPSQILMSMLEPVYQLNCRSLLQSYTMDIDQHHDFFVVTISRLFYYCGSSVQTFFLYFLRDIIHVKDNPQNVVAQLAIVGQFSGALVCYPSGLMSDRCWGGRRKPLVYFSCMILSMATLTVIWAKTVDDMIYICLVLGVGNGIYLTMETSLAVDTLSREEGDDRAQMLGIWGVAAFVGTSLGPMIGGPLLYFLSGSNSDDSYEWSAYAAVLGLSAFYFLCSAGSLCFLRVSEG